MVESHKKNWMAPTPTKDLYDYFRRKKRNQLHLLRYPFTLYITALLLLPFLSPYQHRNVLEPEYIMAKKHMGKLEYYVVAEEMEYTVQNTKKSSAEKYQLEITEPISILGFVFPECHTLLIPGNDDIVLLDNIHED